MALRLVVFFLLSLFHHMKYNSTRHFTESRMQKLVTFSYYATLLKCMHTKPYGEMEFIVTAFDIGKVPHSSFDIQPELIVLVSIARARIGLLAAAGAGLAGLAGIAAPGTNAPGGYSHANTTSLNPSSSAGTSSLPNQPESRPSDIDAFLRRAQTNGHSHIRTLGTLAAINLICWVPLYVCALIAPVGKCIVYSLLYGSGSRDHSVEHYRGKHKIHDYP
jgi:hypothetical protein